MRISNWWSYALICIINYILLLVGSLAIDTRDLIYQSLVGQLEESRISFSIDFYNRMQLWLYVFIPLIVFVKVSLVYLLIYVGMQLKGYKYSGKSLMAIALNAQYVMVTGGFITILYFWITGNYQRIEDLSITPFSVLALFNPSEVEPWLKYPLSLLNIFEIFYWVALIVHWKKLSGKSYGESFDFIASTYGLGMLLWLLVVIFFTI